MIISAVPIINTMMPIIIIAYKVRIMIAKSTFFLV